MLQTLMMLVVNFRLCLYLWTQMEKNIRFLVPAKTAG